MSAKKAVAQACLISVLIFAANFGVFVFGYDHLAVPFLSEEQRVENAAFIMSVIVGAFAVLAALVGVFVYRMLGAGRRS